MELHTEWSVFCVEYMSVYCEEDFTTGWGQRKQNLNQSGIGKGWLSDRRDARMTTFRRKNVNKQAQSYQVL